MRKILISFCILFAALAVNAQTISGIRIDGGDSPILVYFGGSQMCSPTTSCFVANLRAGYYLVEVYASRNARPGDRQGKGQKIYSERVYFKGSGVMDIYVGTGNNIRPGNRPNQDDDYYESDINGSAMDARLFETFYKSVQRETSDANRIKVIDAALVASDFTCEQCLRLVGFFIYDHDKMIVMRMMYPRIVDKQAFFTLISILKTLENKEKMNAFVAEYNASNR